MTLFKGLSVDEEETSIKRGNRIKIPARFIDALNLGKFIYVIEDNLTICIFPEAPLRPIPSQRVELSQGYGRRRDRFTLPECFLHSSLNASFIFGKTITLVLHPERGYIDIRPRMSDEQKKETNKIKPKGS